MSVSTSGRSTYGYVDPNFPNPGGKWDTPVVIYGYTPIFALACFAAVYFFLFLCVHSAQVLRHHSWYFATFPIGLLFEIAGYISRSLSAKNDPYHLLYFILNYFFIVTAPVFLAAGIYTILSGLLVRLDSNRRHSILSPKAIMWFFVLSDIVSTVIQITGAALIGVRYSRREDPNTANNILLGGLAYQVFSTGTFVSLAGIFLFRAGEAIRAAGLSAFVVAFVVSTIMVFLRTCFRLAETAEGLGSKLQTNEVYFACLEFAPISVAVLLLAIWHPGRSIGRRILNVIPAVNKA